MGHSTGCVVEHGAGQWGARAGVLGCGVRRPSTQGGTTTLLGLGESLSHGQHAWRQPGKVGLGWGAARPGGLVRAARGDVHGELRGCRGRLSGNQLSPRVTAMNKMRANRGERLVAGR